MNQKVKVNQLKTYCSSCTQKTNHEVLHEYNEHYTPKDTPEMGIDFAELTWQIVQCKGCENVSFRDYCITSEDYHPITGPEGTEHRYPKVGPDDLKEEQFLSLPEKIRRLYVEIISTFNHGNYTACAVLIRSIIEGIANEYSTSLKLIDIVEVPKGRGAIEWKISQLVEHKLLSKPHGEILHESRILGNRAIHELEAPLQKELKELIRIIERTLYVVFEISEKLSEIRWKRDHNKKRNDEKGQTS